MTHCGSTTSRPERSHDVRPVPAATDQRPGQGCRNPGPAPPSHCAATTTRWRQGPLHPCGPGVAGRTAAPTPTTYPAPTPTARAPRHGAALAPRAPRPTPRRPIPAEASRSTADHPVHSCACSVPEQGEYTTGDTGECTANCSSSALPSPRSPSGRFSRRRHRPGTRPRPHHVGTVPALPSRLELASLPLEGRHHRGDDDAWNIAALVLYLARARRLARHIGHNRPQHHVLRTPHPSLDASPLHRSSCNYGKSTAPVSLLLPAYPIRSRTTRLTCTDVVSPIQLKNEPNCLVRLASFSRSRRSICNARSGLRRVECTTSSH
jgi:hypothetical protein